MKMNDVQVKRTGRKKGSVSVDAKKARKIALAKVNRKGRTNAQIAREVGVCTAVVDRADVHPLIGPLNQAAEGEVGSSTRAHLGQVGDQPRG